MYMRPVAPTQPGVTVAAAWYRMPIRWPVGEGEASPTPEPALDGVPAEPGDALELPVSTLAVPLLLQGADLAGVLVLVNKMPAPAKRPASKDGKDLLIRRAEAMVATLAPTLTSRSADGGEWPTAPWLQAGLREAGWVEEPSLPDEAACKPRRAAVVTPESAASRDSFKNAVSAVEFSDNDIQMATVLSADVTLALVHAQLEVAAAKARQHVEMPSAQNLLRERLRRVLSCAAEAALLARRACRCAASILHAESVLFFRCDAKTLTLWRCANSTSDELPPRSLYLNPRAPRSIAGAVATSGVPHLANAPHAEPALLPGFDAPEGVELLSVLSVPMRTKPSAQTFGVLQAINARQPTHGSSPMMNAIARHQSGLELGRGAADEPAGGEKLRAQWELSVLQMVAEETARALQQLARQEMEDEEEPAAPEVAAHLEALCAAERRLAAAEVKTALIQAAVSL